MSKNNSQEIATSIRLITPRIAEEMLKRNTNNRNISKTQIERMVYAMKNDQWRANGETIKISANGKLLDGQHRLTAIVQSECSCLMMVCEGLSDDVIDTIDIGKRRTFSDYLNINGEQNYGHLSAALHKLAVYQDYYVKNVYVYGTRGMKNKTYQDMEILLKNNPGIRHSVGFIRNSESRRLFEGSILSALHYVLSQANPEQAEIFFNRLATGANLEEGNPILLLRQTAVKWKSNNQKPEAYETMSLIIRAWNAFVTNRPLHSFRFVAEDGFPPVIGLQDEDNLKKVALMKRGKGVGKGKLVRKKVIA